MAVGPLGQAANSGHAPSEPKTLASETDEQRELRRLHQEVDYLCEERDILKKLWPLVSGDLRARYTLMEKMKQEHSLPALAQALEVSAIGFHAHRQKGRRPRR